MTFRPQKRGVLGSDGRVSTDTTPRFSTLQVPACRGCGARNWMHTMIQEDATPRIVIMCAVCNHLRDAKGDAKGLEVH